MAREVNHVFLIGHLGADPEVRYTPDGKAIARIRMATSEQWKDKKTGAVKEVTEWHRIVLFKGLAEIAANYLKKGMKVYVEGKLHTRKWQDQQGHERFITEILAHALHMLDSPANKMASHTGDTVPSAPTTSSEAPSPTASPSAFQNALVTSAPPEFPDDDIPF